MIPWQLLGSVSLPGTPPQDLQLYQRDQEFSLRLGNQELMNSRVHASEEALAELTCQRLGSRSKPVMLIGGLGMGYTLRSALNHLPADAQVIVAELLPEVLEWNEGVLAHLAENPLADKRVKVKLKDVVKLVKAGEKLYDAILLDIDNGPTAMTQSNNNWLYSFNGLRGIFAALKPGGVLGVWSAGPDQRFVKRLEQVRFEVEEKRVKARGEAGGTSHWIWTARRPLR